MPKNVYAVKEGVKITIISFVVEKQYIDNISYVYICFGTPGTEYYNFNAVTITSLIQFFFL